MLWRIKGFKHFLKISEKYRARFYEKENIFEKLLPYAVLFGLTRKWAQTFSDIYKTIPSWYETGSNISVVGFADSLDKEFTSYLGRSFSPPLGGAGGGRSGGVLEAEAAEAGKNSREKLQKI